MRSATHGWPIYVCAERTRQNVMKIDHDQAPDI